MNITLASKTRYLGLESINSFTVSHKLLNPPDSHPIAISKQGHSPRGSNSQRPLRIREVLMVTNQMLLIPGILFHPFIVLYILKHDLTEAVEVGDIRHLRIEKLCHQCARSGLVVDLRVGVSLKSA